MRGNFGWCISNLELISQEPFEAGILLFLSCILHNWRAHLLVLWILNLYRFGITRFPCMLLMGIWLQGISLYDRAREKSNNAAELQKCWHRDSFLHEVWDDWVGAGRAEYIHKPANARWKNWSIAAGTGSAQVSAVSEQRRLLFRSAQFRLYLWSPDRASRAVPLPSRGCSVYSVRSGRLQVTVLVQVLAQQAPTAVTLC